MLFDIIDKYLDKIVKINNPYQFAISVVVLSFIISCSIYYFILTKIMPKFAEIAFLIIMSSIMAIPIIIREKEHIKQKELLEGKIKELEKK